MIPWNILKVVHKRETGGDLSSRSSVDPSVDLTLLLSPKPRVNQ